MNCVMNKKLFSEFFYDELAPYRAEIAESKKQVAESRRENQETLDSLRRAIHDEFVKKYGFSAVPNDVKRKLNAICNSKALLNVLLFITNQPVGNYEEFLTTLEEAGVPLKSNQS